MQINYFKAHQNPLRKFSTSKTSIPFISVHTDTSWEAETNKTGLGFIVIANHKYILLARSNDSTTNTPIRAEINAIKFALGFCIEEGWNPQRIYCDCPGILQLISNFQKEIAWDYNADIQNLKQILNQSPDTMIELIDREENIIADDALANFGRTQPGLSLFVQGRDRSLAGGSLLPV